MQLFRLVIDAAGTVLEKDKLDLGDLTPAARAPFIGPFHGGSGEAVVPLGEGQVAVLTWEGAASGAARGTLAVDDDPCLDLALAGGRDAGADAELLASVGTEWGADAPGVTLFGELAAIDQRPLLVVRRVRAGWPAELAGAEVVLAAVYLDGLPG